MPYRPLPVVVVALGLVAAACSSGGHKAAASRQAATTAASTTTTLPPTYPLTGLPATDPANSLMIGDRSHDMVGAGNNGIKGIGVLYGYGSRDELIGAGARHLCATPAEIPSCIS